MLSTTCKHINVITLYFTAYRYDFVGALRRLNAHVSDVTALPRVAALELQRLQHNGVQLPQRRAVSHYDVEPCSKATALLNRCQAAMLNDYTPAAVSGVGNNCLFQSVSVALYGSEEYYDQLRVRAAIEVAMHRQWYDTAHSDYCAPFKDEQCIVVPNYGDLCRTLTTHGEEADVMGA